MSIKTTRLGEIDVDSGTAVSTAGAATTSAQTGVITTEVLATAAAGSYTFVLTNPLIQLNSILNTVVGKGTATTGGLVAVTTTCAAGSATIVFLNPIAAALNGTVKIAYSVLNVL